MSINIQQILTSSSIQYSSNRRKRSTGSTSGYSGLAFPMSCLKLQKRLAASVLECGVGRVWMDETEFATIAMANSRQQVRRLIANGIVYRRPVGMHSQARHRKRIEAKRKGRHRGFGKRRGGRNARLDSKWQWIRRIRVIRRTLVEFRKKQEIDRHLYRKLYLKAKGNQFRNKRVLVEHIQTLKVEQERERAAREQIEARRARSRKAREKKAGVAQ
jgi:large subunit ribosomal protein L19e